MFHLSLGTLAVNFIELDCDGINRELLTYCSMDMCTLFGYRKVKKKLSRYLRAGDKVERKYASSLLSAALDGGE
jgi:hypothetical protein